MCVGTHTHKYNTWTVEYLPQYQDIGTRNAIVQLLKWNDNYEMPCMVHLYKIYLVLVEKEVKGGCPQSP